MVSLYIYIHIYRHIYIYIFLYPLNENISRIKTRLAGIQKKFKAAIDGFL